MGHLTAVIAAAYAATAFAQQVPFVSITGPDAPRGASFLMEDRVRGGLWMAGAVEGAEGLVYFDGSRFVQWARPFPKVTVSGLAEDRAGGIWLATSGGLYRAFKNRLELLAAGEARDGLTQAAPNVFLASVYQTGARSAELPRVIQGIDGHWKVEAMMATPQVRLQSDRAGNILYVCPGGYCEFRGAEAVGWRAGEALRIVRHTLPYPRSFGTDESVVFRDRFGCVWLRGGVEVKYQCPGETEVISPPGEIADTGYPAISELSDGSIIIPSFGRLATGRPGHFHVYSALNGFPGAVNALAGSDGSIWLSNANGLFVFPPRLRAEFWTEREGLDGNTWSIIRTPSKTFALAGKSLRVLDRDRSRWSLLPLRQKIHELYSGPNGTLLADDLAMQRTQLSDRGKVIGKVDMPDPVTRQEGVQADPRGNLWTCSSEGGLLRHNAAGWNSISTKDGPLAQSCHYFVVDLKGEIWYGNNGREAGFALLEEPSGSRPRVRHFVSGGDVGVATVRFLGVDSRGWIWRGSPVGIYVADAEQARQGEWLYLNRLDGIAGTDANRRSFFADPDGSVWFGLDNSINHLYPPADFLHPEYPPSVFISGYSWTGGDFHMADMVSTIESGAALTAHIGSLQFDRRNALRIRYRLLPEQASWRESKSLDLPLGVLASGSHTLEVQGRIFTGPWSGTVSRSFRILPPVWIGGRFLLSYALAGMLLVTSIQLLRRKRQREERTLMPDLGEWRLSAMLPGSHEQSGATLDGRFHVGELMARGGFANVMAGYDRKERRRCAIKIFRGEVKNKASIVRGFEQEVAALSQIHHPNVVSIYADGLTASGAPYLAMEFVEGKNLRDILKEGPLPGPRVGRLLEQLANALDAIHRRGICHRDLKPENVIVRNNGGVEEEAVLIDFSIAIIKDANETLHGLSRAAGTFDYMAPEQALGHAQPASDIFSLAKVTVEMLTGVRVSELLPSAALDLPARLPGALRKFELDLSEDSMKILADALEFDPAKRPNVASEFAQPIIRDLVSTRVRAGLA